MKQYLLTALAAVTLGGVAQGATVLTFEGVADQTAVDSFYDGGAGGNLGIQFVNGLGLVDSDNGGGGSFANEPSASTVLIFLSGSASTMNVVNGFDTGFSFFYSAVSAGSVEVFDGLNGTGALLATVNLAVQHNANGCVGDPGPVQARCNWTNIGVSFAGVARSATFGGVANRVAFDNITLGDAVAQSTVPEPSTMALSGLGLALAAAVRARRK
jgi:hypothetical protein